MYDARSLFFLLLLTLTPLFAQGQWHGPAAPDSISFQGLLTDTGGDPVTDGTYDLLFKLYKGSSEVWSQNHSNVQVTGGVFNVILSGGDLDTVAFNEPIELGIAVEGESEMVPRTPLTSAAYALGMRGMAPIWVDNGFGYKAFNLIGGAPNNHVSAGVIGGTISGGGGWEDTTPKPDSVTGHWGTVGGGNNNRAGSSATVGGGTGNKATDLWATVGGGVGNKATDQLATIGGGSGNKATANWTTVAGGTANQASLTSATVGGGQSNKASGDRSTVSGGDSNQAAGQFTTVGGGDSNEAIGTGAAVAGGEQNVADGPLTAITGGYNNVAVGGSSMIPGGQWNRTEGIYSFAAGYKARAKHEGSFVWNDRSVTSGDDSLVSTAANQFIVRADGGFGIGTANPQEALHIDAGGPTAIFLGGNGSSGPHGIVFDDDASPGNGVQIMWRASPNRLVIEAASSGTGANPLDAFFFDRDDFNFGFEGTVRPATDDAYPLGTGSFHWTEVFATNGTINSSDANLKRDITTIDHALEQVLQLRPVRFRWRSTPDGDVNLGLIAQEVESVVPEVVRPPESEDSYYGLNYPELVPLLIRAIQEQNQQIELLKSQNEEFRSRLVAIEYASSR